MKNILKRPEDIFVLFCLCWGIFFMFINPPFQASDETSHIFKMYGFTQGTLTFQQLIVGKHQYAGLNLPVSLYYIAQENLPMVMRPDKKTSLSETKLMAKFSLKNSNQKFFMFFVPTYT